MSGEDAKKFRDQVSFGRPKAAAIEGVREGVKLAQSLSACGKLTVTLAIKAPRKGR